MRAENVEIGLIGQALLQILYNIVIFVVKTSTLGIIGHRASLGTGLGLHVEFGRSFHLLHEHLGREGAQGSAPDQRNVNGSHISSGDSELPCHKNLSTAFCWNMLEPSKRTGAKPIAASPARVSLSPQICDHPMDYPRTSTHSSLLWLFTKLHHVTEHGPLRHTCPPGHPVQFLDTETRYIFGHNNLLQPLWIKNPGL